MSFPNPPVPDQEYTHDNGITYIYSAPKKAWEIFYKTATTTASLPLVNPSNRYLLSGSTSLPDSSGLITQSDYNIWLHSSLVKVDETSRVDSGEDSPGDADTNQLWYKPSTGSLYVYYNDGDSTQWVEIGGGEVDLSGYVTDAELATDQQRQDDELAVDQQRQDDEFAVDQQRQDTVASNLSNRIDALEADEGSDLSQVAFKNQDNLFTETNTFGNLIITEVPTEATDGTNKFYTDAQDTILHGMVDVIVGRKVYAKYQLQQDDRSIRSGKYKLLSAAEHDNVNTQANDWEDVRYIYFSYDDYDGNRRALTELKVGDQLSMESPNGAGTFIINQTKVNGVDSFFGLTRISFVGDPTVDDVYQMVAGDEGRITAEQVGEIVLNRFNAVDAVRNSYGKIFTGVQSYDPNSALEPGTIAWSGGTDMYISDVDSNNFSWCSNTNATFTLDSKQYFTIYSETSSGQIGSMHMRGSFTTFFKNSNHVKLGGVERLHGSSTLYSNKWYIVNLGGFM